MTTFYSTSDRGIELFNDADGEDRIISADMKSGFTAENISDIHAEWLSQQDIPGELAYNNAIEHLTDIAAGNYTQINTE